MSTRDGEIGFSKEKSQHIIREPVNPQGVFCCFPEESLWEIHLPPVQAAADGGGENGPHFG
jgi:hypothetical protein